MATPDPLVDGATVLFFMTLVTVAAFFFGKYLARVFTGSLSRGIPGRIEGGIFRVIGTGPDQETGWRQYAVDMLIFNGIGFAVLLILLLVQGILPLNPAGVPGFDPLRALNIAASFVTNTNWQVYSGETAASYLAQMAGFTVQNFLSAATGIAVAIAVMRGITRRNTDRIGMGNRLEGMVHNRWDEDIYFHIHTAPFRILADDHRVFGCSLPSLSGAAGHLDRTGLDKGNRTYRRWRRGSGNGCPGRTPSGHRITVALGVEKEHVVEVLICQGSCKQIIE